ncbi:MAG: class I SAM-dependent methyltransferase [Spirochaetales bacterium]|nr:class I SAM-dependent methyltransferase [Spirochaetales bacterium]
MKNQEREESFDQKAQKWDSDPEKLERARLVAAKMKAIVPLHKVNQALDFGTGTGLLSMALKEQIHKIDCLDTSEGMIQVLKEKIKQQNIRNLVPLHGDLSHPAIQDQYYDLIFTMMVLHHVDNVQPLLTDFYGRINPHGYLCVIDLFKEDGSFHGAGFQGKHGFDPKELSCQLLEAGFSSVEYSHCLDISKITLSGQSKLFPVFILIAEK